MTTSTSLANILRSTTRDRRQAHAAARTDAVRYTMLSDRTKQRFGLPATSASKVPMVAGSSWSSTWSTIWLPGPLRRSTSRVTSASAVCATTKNTRFTSPSKTQGARKSLASNCGSGCVAGSHAPSAYASSNATPDTTSDRQATYWSTRRCALSFAFSGTWQLVACTVASAAFANSRGATPHTHRRRSQTRSRNMRATAASTPDVTRADAHVSAFGVCLIESVTQRAGARLRDGHVVAVDRPLTSDSKGTLCPRG